MDAYGVPDYSAESLEKMFPKLASDPAMQAHFRRYYYSGNHTGCTITNQTWPVYWSGVGNVWEQGNRCRREFVLSVALRFEAHSVLLLPRRFSVGHPE